MQFYLMVILAVCVVISQAQAETAVERGQYLVEIFAACGNCHTTRGPQGPIREQHLGGGQKVEEAFGVAIIPNITPDQETGIGAWTDAEIIQLLRCLSHLKMIRSSTGSIWPALSPIASPATHR
jgi:mono/diheme cytochrome c family protein